MGLRRLGLSGAAVLVVALSGPAFAACTCECVDGKPKSICEYGYEQQYQQCYQSCPMAPTAVKPVPSPTLPPVGMKSCEDKHLNS